MIKLLVLLLPIYLLSSPQWFHNTEHKDYELISYGVDKDLLIARNIAKAEISNQINVKISSDTNIDKTLENNTYTKSIKNNIQTSSNTTLQGIKILKEEKIDNLWYVSVLYDNRTLIQKIKAKKSMIKASKLTNTYLNKTEISKEIFKTLGFKTNIKLVRKDKNWFINIDDNLFTLKNEDFIQLFKNKTNKILSLKTNKKIYQNEDSMNFKISSKKTGFISLLYSEVNGKVGILFDNIKIKKKLLYPKNNAKDKLIAYNPSNKTITEFYIAIYSKNRLDLSSFEQVSQDLLDESNYNFDKLLELMNTNEYSSNKIKIRKNR